MSSRVLLQHQTRYQYDRPVYLTTHLIRLKPAAHCRTPIENYTLTVSPENHVLHWQQDPFGNFIARVDFMGPVEELLIQVKMKATLIAINPFDFYVEESSQYFPFEYSPQLKNDLRSYLEVTEQGAEMIKWLQKVNRSKQSIVEFLVMLNAMVYNDIHYTTRLEPGVQSCEETLKCTVGSCRDSAWLLVQVLRNLGLAARFVSGYLVQLTPHSNLTQEKGDTTALHAWAEVYIPGAGWIGLDPTSGLLAGEGHLPLACTPSPESAAPVSGTSEITKTSFDYSSTVIRLHVS
jgi:transglutaminase-like putative cysteine protease